MDPGKIVASLGALTEREREILSLLCGGYGYQGIADQLVISKQTVRTTMHNVNVKLGIDGLELMQRYHALFTHFCPTLRQGILPPPPPEQKKAIRVSRKLKKKLDAEEQFFEVMIQQTPVQIGATSGGTTAAASSVPSSASIPISPSAPISSSPHTSAPPPPAQPGSSPPLGSSAVPPPQLVAYKVAPPKRKRFRFGKVLALLVIVLLLAGGGWFVLRNLSLPLPSVESLPAIDLNMTPGGIGTGLTGGELEIVLVDYDFRTSSNTVDKAPTAMTVRLTNTTNQPMTVVLNLFLIEGTDNRGIPYGQFHAVGAENCMSSAFGCVIGAPDPKKVESYEFEILAGEVWEEEFELLRKGESIYDINRVDIDTDWIDIVFSNIRYRSDKVKTVSVEWRLTR